MITNKEINKNKIPVLYIISTGHSGSTLLDMLLSAHSKIFGVGEFRAFSSRKNELNNELKEQVCACGEKISNCPFWKKVLENIDCSLKLDVRRNGINSFLGVDKYIFKNGEAVSIKDYLKSNEKIYENILKFSDKEFIVDSSKQSDRAELLSRSKKLNIIFLHLVRDGRGVMWSYKKKYKKTLFPIFLWLFTNLKAEIIKKRNKNIRMIFLRYEDLVDNPEKELARILKTIGLSFEKGMLNFSRVEQHQIAGNRLRLRKDREIKKDLSWKENLSWFDLFLFYLIAGFLNKYYGY